MPATKQNILIDCVAGEEEGGLLVGHEATSPLGHLKNDVQHIIMPA